jgi:membrane-associated protein
MLEFFQQFSNLEAFIRWGGLLVLFIVIYAESGLLIGFFLPGDSLLFTAGLLAAAGFFNIYVLISVLALAAILGDQTGYLTGKHIGRRLFQRKDSRFFKQEYLRSAEQFYEKFGVKTIILARFIPIIRTFAPIVAGIGNMQYKKFVTYNLVGGIAWVILLCGSGYYLVRVIPGLKNYIEYVIFGIIIVSLIPAVMHYYKNKIKTRTKA